MDIAEALDFIKKNQDGTFVTLRADGRPHVAVVTAAVVDGHLWISTKRDLVKERNVRRDGRVAFTTGVHPWVAIEGTARVDDGDSLLERLRLYYRTAAGEHPDWDDYDRAMVRDQRVIIDVTPARAYGFGF